MAADINPAFDNNVNVVAIRANGTMGHLYTDRTIDIDGDGDQESVSIVTTQRGGNKVKNVVTVPSGVARTLVKEKLETDGGVDTSGIEFTHGVS